MRRHTLVTAIVVFGLAGTSVFTDASPVYGAVQLSGAIVFSTDSSGSRFFPSAMHDVVYNTRGGDVFSNLWVILGGVDDPFLNGPDEDGASISIPLAVGSHTFTLYADGTPDFLRDYFGMNLFFNGNNDTPGISVFAATDTSSDGGNPEYFPNQQPTFSLDGATVAGAGSLSFIDGQTTITLTSFRWSAPTVEGKNRVGGGQAVPDGFNDFVGQFTFEVRTIPEPSSLILWSLLGSVAIGVTWWRRTRAG